MKTRISGTLLETGAAASRVVSATLAPASRFFGFYYYFYFWY
jgi:hypothetical protein